MASSCKWLLSASAALSFHLCSLVPVQAAAYGTNSFADAFVTTGPTGNLVGSNYGAAGSLALSAAGLPKGEFQTALQFDLAAARNSFDSQFGAGQWSLQSVTLQLTATPTNNAIFNATTAGQFGIFWTQNDSSQEGTGSPQTPTATGITYTSLQGLTSGNDQSLGTFSFDGATSGAATYTLNLTSGLTGDLLSGGFVSLRLVAAEVTVSYLFNSRNFATASARPLLTITAVPEPRVLALDLIGLLFISRRFARSRNA